MTHTLTENARRQQLLDHLRETTGMGQGSVKLCKAESHVRWDTIRDQLQEQGWRADWRHTTAGHNGNWADAERKHEGVTVRLVAFDMDQLMPVAQSVWVGLHE